MPRAKKFTIVRVVDGKVEANTYENDGAARDALAHIEPAREDEAPNAPAPLVFIGEPVPFVVNRTPTVTLGEPRGRKPRAAKAERKPRAAKKGTTVQPEFFQEPTNGAAATPTTTTPVQE